MSVAAALVLALATFAAAASTGASAAPHTARPAARTAQPKPTIVFVHGAWADSNGWDAEITALTKLGYPVIAASNPLQGLTSDSDYVRSILKTITGPIVLVGHSYGGAVITNAARGVSNVKALVYLAGFAPKKGESLATILPAKRFPGSLLGPKTLIYRQAPNPEAKGGEDTDLYIKASAFRKVFAGDVSVKRAALEAATQRPLSLTAFTQKSGVPAWKTIPSWDLITLHDHAIPRAGQRFMAHRMHAHIETVPSAHDVMVSHPKAVDRIILQAVRSLK